MDVLEYRLKNEYGVNVVRRICPSGTCAGLRERPPLDRLRLTSTTAIAEDRSGRPVLLFENDWSIRLALKLTRAWRWRNRRPNRSRRYGAIISEITRNDIRNIAIIARTSITAEPPWWMKC